jgi:hypothetical protein
MSKCHVIVSMKEGWKMCIVPKSLFRAILMPSKRSGLPRSFMSKLPLISLTMLSIDSTVMAARSPSSTYHLAISTKLSLPYQKNTIVSALPGLNPNFSISCFNISCHTLPDCFNPYSPFFNLQTKFSFPSSMKPSGCLI